MLDDQTPNNNQDVTLPQMLSEAGRYMEEQERLHPLGIRGAMVIIQYTDERLEEARSSGNDDDLPWSSFSSGLNTEHKLALLDSQRHIFVTELILNHIRRES